MRLETIGSDWETYIGGFAEMAIISRRLFMIRYYQRENNSGTAIPSGGIVSFDTLIAQSQSPDGAYTDFYHHDDGTIDINRAGTYMVHWYVVNMAGYSTLGQPYMLQRMDYSLTPPAWSPVAGTTNQIKVSQTSGFAVIDVSQDEINDHNAATIALFSTADADANLTLFEPKAGILIFGMNPNEVAADITQVNNSIDSIFTQLEAIYDFVHLSDVQEFPSDTPLEGLGAAVINSGYTYNFWGTGTLSNQRTLTQGTTYTILDSSQFPPLTYYQGDSTIGTLWIETPAPSSEVFSMPIRFDGTGIYFIPDTTYTDLPIGTAFRFTQSLILVAPSPTPDPDA